MKFPIKDFFSKLWIWSHEEILNRKLHFLSSDNIIDTIITKKKRRAKNGARRNPSIMEISTKNKTLVCKEDQHANPAKKV